MTNQWHATASSRVNNVRVRSAFHRKQSSTFDHGPFYHFQRIMNIVSSTATELFSIVQPYATHLFLSLSLSLSRCVTAMSSILVVMCNEEYHLRANVSLWTLRLHWVHIDDTRSTLAL
jgi:hypothetical protein